MRESSKDRVQRSYVDSTQRDNVKDQRRYLGSLAESAAREPPTASNFDPPSHERLTKSKLLVQGQPSVVPEVGGYARIDDVRVPLVRFALELLNGQPLTHHVVVGIRTIRLLEELLH